MERAQRINHTLSLLPPELRQASVLRPLDLLVIAPSRRIDDIALKHIGALASYLLFESDFTRELIALGEADALARGDEVRAFFHWPSPQGIAWAAARPN